MLLRRIVLCTVLALPLATAHCPRRTHAADVGDWRAVHGAIYDAENLIALLEANPQTDDGYKAPIIGRARADVEQLNATLPRPQWSWTNPCCYSRKPIHIH